MTDGYTIARDDRIIRLTINRPNHGNMLTLAMACDIAARLRDIGSDDAVNAIVIRGDGENFCMGRDPAGAPEGKPTTALEIREALIEPILGLYAAIRESEVPVISGVQGMINGMGCGVTAMCDVTIAADNSRFALPEMRANLPPTLAMLAHLDRIPPKSLLLPFIIFFPFCHSSNKPTTGVQLFPNSLVEASFGVFCFFGVI